MTDGTQNGAAKPWVRIPNGTLVRHREGGREGYIDGLTELVIGPLRNPDGRTQYRVNIGEAERFLAVEDDLFILTDEHGMVLMLKQKPPYRSLISTQLRNAFPADRFVVSA